MKAKPRGSPRFGPRVCHRKSSATIFPKGENILIRAALKNKNKKRRLIFQYSRETKFWIKCISPTKNTVQKCSLLCYSQIKVTNVKPAFTLLVNKTIGILHSVITPISKIRNATIDQIRFFFFFVCVCVCVCVCVFISYTTHNITLNLTLMGVVSFEQELTGIDLSRPKIF